MATTIYFKTRKAFNAFLRANDLNETTVNCSGGETQGARIYNENGQLDTLVVLDAIDYDNAPVIERGE